MHGISQCTVRGSVARICRDVYLLQTEICGWRSQRTVKILVCVIIFTKPIGIYIRIYLFIYSMFNDAGRMWKEVAVA